MYGIGVIVAGGKSGGKSYIYRYIHRRGGWHGECYRDNRSQHKPPERAKGKENVE